MKDLENGKIVLNKKDLRTINDVLNTMMVKSKDIFAYIKTEENINCANALYMLGVANGLISDSYNSISEIFEKSITDVLSLREGYDKYLDDAEETDCCERDCDNTCCDLDNKEVDDADNVEELVLDSNSVALLYEQGNDNTRDFLSYAYDKMVLGKGDNK